MNVNDVRIKRVTIKLDKPRTLQYDLNSFAELEEIYGSVDAAMQQLQTGSVKGLRLILWAGLIHEEMVLNDKGQPTGEYKITPLEVGSWVEIKDLQMLSEKIHEAMENHLPQSSPEDPTPSEVTAAFKQIVEEGKPVPSTLI